MGRLILPPLFHHSPSAFLGNWNPIERVADTGSLAAWSSRWLTSCWELLLFSLGLATQGGHHVDEPLPDATLGPLRRLYIEEENGSV